MLFSQHPGKRGKKDAQMLPEILDSSQTHSVATLEEAWVGWEIAMLSACALTVSKGWKSCCAAAGGTGRAHRTPSPRFPGRWLPATLSGSRARLGRWEHPPGCLALLPGQKRRPSRYCVNLALPSPARLSPVATSSLPCTGLPLRSVIIWRSGHHVWNRRQTPPYIHVI